MEYYEDKIISELLPKETIVINETNIKLLLLDYYSITMVIAGKVLKGGEMKDCMYSTYCIWLYYDEQPVKLVYTHLACCITSLKNKFIKTLQKNICNM